MIAPGVRSVAPLRLYEMVNVLGETPVDIYGLLYFLVGGLRPSICLDVGTQSGRSAIAMAAAMVDHKIDGGMVFTIDLPTNRYHLDAVNSVKRLGLQDIVRCEREDAGTALARICKMTSDIPFAFIDEAKENYHRDFMLLRDKVQFVVFHDVTHPKFAHVIQPQIEQLKVECTEFDFFLPCWKNYFVAAAFAQRR